MNRTKINSLLDVHYSIIYDQLTLNEKLLKAMTTNLTKWYYRMYTSRQEQNNYYQYVIFLRHEFLLDKKALSELMLDKPKFNEWLKTKYPGFKI